ncbi:tetratricopeptide repeat protein [Hyphobacterium sp.]|uniref:tetratricopeptide repeat protein n=1 Tax=Hyphobacterium sp. TaxID=2004662 RepID=UPI003BAB49D5
MADIFHEVEEELRKDKYNELLRSWGPWVLGAAIAIVAGAAGWQGWQYLDRQQAFSESDRYFAALDLVEAQRLQEADLALQQLADDASSGYTGLALMQRGEIALSQGDTASAGFHFEQAADAFNVNTLGDLARVKAAMALFEDLSIDDLQNRLGPVMQSDRPYRLLAMEVIAAKAFSIGDLERARREFEAISNDLDALALPVAQRAQAALSVITRLEQTGQSAAGDAGTEMQFDLGAALEQAEAETLEDAISTPQIPGAELLDALPAGEGETQSGSNSDDSDGDGQE